ncbi:MAG TPA: alpha/beta-hydrolase family protein, partial [Propionibacteriaceae bacterium]|nr:alpha/beta-hydrolase family protein [Propionibacteriaceae bacterium]
FIANGPTKAQIETITAKPARDPIRIFAGLGNADTLESRAQLAVKELQRTGAFGRKVLVVATPTGSGWLEPQAVDSIEYLYGGDTAIVAMQYSYEPSWVSFLFAADLPGTSSKVLFDAVRAEWAKLPEGERPKLVVYGLSLGAMGGQESVGDLNALVTQTDGALFGGPPNASQPWRDLTYGRDAGSPMWLPVIKNGEQVRFMSKNGDLAKTDGEWATPRIVYQQHSTDAVTWLDPKVIWQRPEGLSGSAAEGGRAADVSDSMIWMPGVTYLHLVADMMLGLAPPAAHGHNYGDVIVDGWVGVLPDHGLDAAAVDRVQALMETYPFVGADSVWE